MGQKVNPIGIRVGIIRDWDARWYADDKNYVDLLHEDFKVRKFVKDKLFDSGLISFDSDLNVIISSKLSSYCRFHIPFNVDKSILMPPSEELFKNLEYHRNNIFLP